MLVCKAGDETRTLNMYQSARISDSDCVLDLDATAIEAPAAGKTVEIPFSTNLVYNLDEMFLTLTYPEGQEPAKPWITLKGVEKEKVTVEVAPNDAGMTRTANLRLSHTDAGSYNSTEGDTVHSNTVLFLQTQ